MHRDLKSANLLLTEDKKHIKVCDFGLAKDLALEGASGHTIVGTPPFMAPEICKYQQYSYSADVFSFAMVLYELATRTSPPAR